MYYLGRYFCPMPHQTQLSYTGGRMGRQWKVKPLWPLSFIILTVGFPLMLAACGALQPSPTPSPTPVPLTAAEILALSRDQMEKVKTLRMEVNGKFQQGDVKYPFKMDGEMELPDRVLGTVEFWGEQKEFLSVGEENFIAEPGSGFERDDDDEIGVFFLQLLKPVLGPGAHEPFTDLKRQRDEPIEEQELYHITFRMDMLEFIERFNDGEEIKGVEIRAGGELFIHQESLLPHRFMLNCESCLIPLGQGLDLVVEFGLSRFNETAAITLPPEVVKLLESPPTPGPTQAQMAERDNLQTAIDTYLADKALVTVPARTAPSPSTNDFSSATTLDLTDYLRGTTTTFYYCWDDTGLVTQQDNATATCPSP